MNEMKMLIGSLSNDMFRVAGLSQRGAMKAAEKFLAESKRWAIPLKELNTPQYISKITHDISNRKANDISIESAEQYLMYGVLLQNYSLHIK